MNIAVWHSRPAECRSLAAQREQVLLLAVQPHINGEERDRLRVLLTGSPDWNWLVGCARWQQVLPLLHWNLSRNVADQVPAAVSEYLANAFQNCLRRNLRFTAELLEIIHLLADYGIPTLAYKGPALAAGYYPNLGLREFGDLDLLVHKADITRARDLLVAKGCVPEFSLTEKQEAAYLASEYNVPLRRADGTFHVELHWDILPVLFSVSLEVEKWWQRAVQVKLSHTFVACPAPEDMLLALCVHGGKHGWAHLPLVCDIAALLRTNPSLDWGRVQDQAHRAGAERQLLLGLGLAHKLLDTALPESIHGSLAADPVCRRLMARATGFLFHSDQRPPLLAIELFSLRLARGVRARVRYLSGRAFTPGLPEWSLFRLPEALSFLYAVVRLLRLAGLALRAVALRFVEAMHTSGSGEKPVLSPVKSDVGHPGLPV